MERGGVVMGWWWWDVGGEGRGAEIEEGRGDRRRNVSWGGEGDGRGGMWGGEWS